MEFSEVNKNRHAVKSFNGEKINSDLLKEILTEATLAPSAHNIQPWHFVIVASQEKRAALSTVLPVNNAKQHESAGATIVVCSDVDLPERVIELVEIGGEFLAGFTKEALLEKMPLLFESYTESQLANYLALNIGLVAQNILLSANNRTIKTNVILGFDKTGVTEILGLDERYHPELILTLGYSDDEGKASYRLPVDFVTDIV
ncbi:MAG: nitroreductase family protein [Streptococcaceae bacterium]|nr:nitroreductase family protein [Streptococcaceae bacterium]